MKKITILMFLLFSVSWAGSDSSPDTCASPTYTKVNSNTTIGCGFICTDNAILDSIRFLAWSTSHDNKCAVRMAIYEAVSKDSGIFIDSTAKLSNQDFTNPVLVTTTSIIGANVFSGNTYVVMVQGTLVPDSVTVPLCHAAAADSVFRWTATVTTTAQWPAFLNLSTYGLETIDTTWFPVTIFYTPVGQNYSYEIVTPDTVDPEQCSISGPFSRGTLFTTDSICVMDSCTATINSESATGKIKAAIYDMEQKLIDSTTWVTTGFTGIGEVVLPFVDQIFVPANINFWLVFKGDSSSSKEIFLFKDDGAGWQSCYDDDDPKTVENHDWPATYLPDSAEYANYYAVGLWVTSPGPIHTGSQTQRPNLFVDEGSWNNPESTAVSDNRRANFNATNMHRMRLYDFNFSMPGTATFDSLRYYIEGYGTGGTSAARQCSSWVGSSGYNAKTSKVRHTLATTEGLVSRKLVPADLSGWTADSLNSDSMSVVIKDANATANILYIDYVYISLYWHDVGNKVRRKDVILKEFSR